MFETKKQTCKVCGNKFELKKENRYTASRRESIFCIPTYYDAFDCPVCGCQNIVGVRESSCLSDDEKGTGEEDDRK